MLNTDMDSDVASAINISVNAFSNRKRSGSVPYSEFVQLAESKNVNLNWLLTGEGPIYKGTTSPDNENDKIAGPIENYSAVESTPERIIRNENSIQIPQWKNPDPENYHYVPEAEASLSAGGGSFVLSEKTTGKHYAFRTSFLSSLASSLKNLILMKVTGDSMEPKIENGDTVMIDTGRRQIRSGAIYALGYDDVIMIKEIDVLPGGQAMILSRNRAIYPPYKADIRTLRIIGQVIWSDRILIR